MSDRRRDDEVTETLKYYQDLYETHGSSAKALGWDEERQQIRFNVLLSAFTGLSCPRVLDIGCGFGDLNRALAETFDEYQYVGVDVTPEFLQVAERRYADADYVSFVRADFLDLDVNSKFDIAIASGTFNQRFASGRNWEFIEAAFEKAFRHVTVGLAFDFLSDRVEHRHAHSFHGSPERVLGLALANTRAVLFRNDYMPFEFSIFAFRDDSFRTPRPVFNRFLAREA